MSTALSVEKTSKRGGRIVHEKDLMPPPMFAMAPPPNPETDLTPPHVTPGRQFTRKNCLENCLENFLEIQF